ncbi:MAG: dodecin family protein [Pyrinomonadaceae bacterium]
MSVARVTEITASSTKSFEDALQAGIKRASKTLDNVTGAWIHDHEVSIQGGNITEYKIRMKVTFILND